jgi:transcriptional regulator with XRE-family HTH domain
MSKQPTPLQIAKYGHIAGALRAFLAERGWSPSELGRQLGIAPSGPHVWVKAQGAPGLATQKKLAKLTGLPRETFVPHKPDMAGPASSPALLPGPASRRVGEVLAFTVNDAGEARIRLDVTLPLAQAMPLVRLLLDAEAVQRLENITHQASR